MRNFKVTVDGVSYDVTVEEVSAFAPKAVQPVPAASVPAPVAAASIPAASAPAPVAAANIPAPAPVAAAASSQDTAGGTPIIAPMPGMLLSFTVKEGSEVKKGQPVLVLEAMKMENDISAPCDGKIYFSAVPGSNISTGDTLAVIK